MKAYIRQKFTDKQIKEILKRIVILVDTREQENKHILEYFTKKKITFVRHKLDFCDYSAMLSATPELGIEKDIFFDKEIVVERKGHLEELSQNLAQKREQFNNEWLRSGDSKKLLLIERGSYGDIIDGKYNTNFQSESFLASILALESKYNIRVMFVGKEHAGKFIYAQLYYHIRQVLLD